MVDNDQYLKAAKLAVMDDFVKHPLRRMTTDIIKVDKFDDLPDDVSTILSAAMLSSGILDGAESTIHDIQELSKTIQEAFVWVSSRNMRSEILPIYSRETGELVGGMSDNGESYICKYFKNWSAFMLPTQTKAYILNSDGSIVETSANTLEDENDELNAKKWNLI